VNISVIIPTYNRYTFLKQALESVYAQTYPPKEVIVVDDGSDDATQTIQKDFPHILYIYQENSGVSAARNRGVSMAKYEWIAFLDSDDSWQENKLQEHVDFHKNNSKILMSYTDEIWIRNHQEIQIPKKFKKIGKNAFLENLAYCNIAPSSACLHKSLFEKYGLFDTSLEVCEDYDLWLRITRNEKIALIDKKLIKKYAGHENQLSFKYWGMDRFRVQTLEKLLRDASPLHKRDIIAMSLNKYKLLAKGAFKYDKKQELTLYQKRIEILEAM